MSAISVIQPSTGSKGTGVFWQTSAGDLALLHPQSSLKLHLWPLPGSPYPVPRAEMLVRYLGSFSAVPNNPGFEMSMYLHKCCPAYFLVPTGALW